MKIFFIVMIVFSFLIGQQSEMANQCENKPDHKYNWDYGKCEETKK